MKSVKCLSAHALKAMFVLLAVISSGCSRNTEQVWDDTKSCGRHITRGVKALAGRPVSSRQVLCKEDFVCWQEPLRPDNSFQECEFIPIRNSDCNNEIAMAEIVRNQPRETPGDSNSSIPGINAFRDPSTQSDLRNVFKNIQFEYNSNWVKGKENMDVLQAIADYMKSHPGVYIFVEGHCDERGPEAYNLALGTRRSNAVRNALIQNGVDGDHIFTISYGTERPLVMESHEEAWAKNRRAEFKIYLR